MSKTVSVYDNLGECQMGITIDQANVLNSIAECGSFLKAAEKLGKRHSALIQVIKTLESETKLRILDRSQYRATLTPTGNRILEECRRLLAMSRELEEACQKLNSGWEPYLRIVLDGIIPFDSVLRTIEILSQETIPTKIQIMTEFHSGVEDVFIQRGSQLMIALTPPQKLSLESVPLTPFSVYLVAHKNHPLVAGKRTNTLNDLRPHRFLTVREAGVLLDLNTAVLAEEATFHFNDFTSKKQAIIRGLGFGWLPGNIIEKELKAKQLKVIRWTKPSVHTFFPHLYYHGENQIGRATRLFLETFKKLQSVPPCENCGLHNHCDNEDSHC